VLGSTSGFASTASSSSTCTIIEAAVAGFRPRGQPRRSRPDEWFEEPDDLERVQRAITAIEAIDDPVKAAAIIACRVARAQGFAEGNKRTGLLLARWVLDRNGVEGAMLLPPADREFADLLVTLKSEQLIYLNDGAAFKLVTPEEKAQLQKALNAEAAPAAAPETPAAGADVVEEAGK
jgi:prophage maintenance system killer protein